MIRGLPSIEGVQTPAHTPAFLSTCFIFLFAALLTSRRRPRATAKKAKGLDSQKFRRKLMKSSNYYRNLKDVESAHNSLHETFGSDLLKAIRANGHTLTVGNVTIHLAVANGFCWGVERAIAIAREAKQRFPNAEIWLTNEIIHNPTVNEDLASLGLNFIPTASNGEKDYSCVTEGDVVVLPAFGATIHEMALLVDRKATIVDATCPWVSKVWNAVEKHKKARFSSIIHGKKSHEESIATASFAGKYLVVLNLEEAEKVIDYIINGGDKEAFLEYFKGAYSEGFDPDTDLDYLGVANQTTMMKGETETIGKLFQNVMLRKFGIEEGKKRFMAFNTICDATQERQDAVYEMLDSYTSDFCLVVGGFNSSNTKHLVEIVQERGLPGYHIDDAGRIGGESGLENVISHKPIDLPAWKAMKNLDLTVTKGFLSKKPVVITVTSGASTPDMVVENCLRKIIEIHGNL